MERHSATSRNRNRRTIAPVLMGLLFSVGLLAQQKDAKPAEKQPASEKQAPTEKKAPTDEKAAPTALAADTESAEHKFARQRYEELKSQCDMLESEYDKNVAKLAAAQSLANKAMDQGKTDEWRAFLLETLKDATHSLALNRQLQPIATDLMLWKKRLTYADDCARLFHDTIDKKSSDLIVRETDSIAGCKSLDLYPPQK